MAAPGTFPEANWEHGGMPCFIDDEQVVVCWQLTPEEVLEIVRTGRVWLGIVGQALPATWLLGTTPFTQPVEPTGIIGSSEPLS